MPTGQSLTLQDLISQRRGEEFVGRRGPLQAFQQNLDLPLDDPRRWFILDVHGPAGVGKTWLLARMRQLAASQGALTCWTDERDQNIPDVLHRFATELEAQGLSCNAFKDKYRFYRRQRHEVESDPEAPEGLAYFVGTVLARLGLRLARQVPIGGTLVELLDEDQVAQQLGEWVAYLYKRLTREDAVEVILEPAAALTPLFLEDVRKGLRGRTLVLFFDAFEQTGAFLEYWLLDLLSGRFGPVPASVLFVIAGREPLDPSRWSGFGRVTHTIKLEPFTDEELTAYLRRKGITDPDMVAHIRRLTGNLPLLVATVTAVGGNGRLSETSDMAVDQFLQWAPDATARAIAINAALPRRLNRDVFAIVAGEEAADRFEWLVQLPFVEETADGWVYHEVVRYQLVRRKRRESPQEWRALHERLAEYYEAQQAALDVPKNQRWQNPEWLAFAVEATYHRLCAHPEKSLPLALNHFVLVLDAQPAFAPRWAEAIRQGGDDAGAEDVRRWGKRLLLAVTLSGRKGRQTAVEALTDLIESGLLEGRSRGLAYLHRGLAHAELGLFDAAERDFTAASRVLRGNSRPWLYRAELRLERGDARQALTDFTRALDQDPSLVRAWYGRGLAHLSLGRRRQALADINRALRLRPDHIPALLARGELYRASGNLKLALRDYEEVLRLEPGNPEALTRRGYLRLVQGQLREAITDFNEALKQRPEHVWAMAYRGEAYRLLGYYTAALADFNRVLERQPDNAWVLASRGELFRSMAMYERALADLERAVALNPDDLWARTCRGVVLIHLGRPKEALKDLTTVVEKDPTNAWALANRAEAYRRLRQLSAALRDITRAIRLAPDEDWYYYGRALVYLSYSRRKMAKARRDLEKAIAIAEARRQSHREDWANLLNLALYYLALGETEKAETLYREAFRGGATPHHIRAALDDVRTLSETLAGLLETEPIERLHEERLGELKAQG